MILDQILEISSEHTSFVPYWFHVLNFQESEHNVIDSGLRNVCDLCSVSVAKNFVHRQTASDYGYHSLGELARFVYCLLQKTKQGSSLPPVEQWKQFVVANHSKFPSIADEEFLAGTKVLAALNKTGNSYLKLQFQRDARRLLEDFTNSVLSTVAARFEIGQGLSCFCPAIIIGGDNHAPLHLLGLFLDGILERVRIKGNEIEACRAEYHSFVQELRQLERSSTRSRPDVGDVLSFCSSQTHFRAHHYLFKICIMTIMVKHCDRSSRN